MSNFDDMTDEELKNHVWELEEEIRSITEQIDGVYQLNLTSGPEDRSWLFRALSARRHRRALLRTAQQAVSARNPAKASKEIRRANHIGQITAACFVQVARESIAPKDFDELMTKAKHLASLKVDENGAPVQASA